MEKEPEYKASCTLQKISVVKRVTFRISVTTRLTVLFQMKLNIKLNVCFLLNGYIEPHTRHTLVSINCECHNKKRTYKEKR